LFITNRIHSAFNIPDPLAISGMTIAQWASIELSRQNCLESIQLRESFFLSLGLLSLVLFFSLTETAHTYPLPVPLNQHIGFADGPGTTNGGEFRVYDWNSKEELFRSFCLETNEYLSYGTEFVVAGISQSARDGGSRGPSPDPIDPRSAYLYHHFYWGTLPYYNYDNTPNALFPTRNASANALQKAIWYIEKENWGEQNYYTQLANNAVTGYNFWTGLGDVRAINLTDVLGNKKQDQLTVVPVPGPASLLLLGSGVIGLFAIGKKRSWKLPLMKGTNTHPGKHFPNLGNRW